MKKIVSSLTLLFLSCAAFAEARFPKPDFTSGYEYPEIVHGVPAEQFWNWLDIILLVLLMGIVAWAVHKRRSRTAIFSVSIVSVLYFGFFRSGCVCSVGSIQNVILALVDSSYHLPLVVLLLFILPILFTFLFGRVFCAGVCPLGALQELVNVRNFRISRAVSSALSCIPWVYLAFTLLYAATRSQFLICRFDPFIGIFRFGGDAGMILFGVILLLLSVFVGRPFCRFLCPYGAILSLFGKVSLRKVSITSEPCINCTLCHNACPVDAIRPPYANRVKESRMQGVRRLLLYFLLLPLLTAGMALLIGGRSDTLSRANKEVHLYDMLRAQEADPGAEMSLEVEAFYSMGRSMEELEGKVFDIQKSYHTWSLFAGALIGFVLGCRLIRLSVKRTRKTYEIDAAACVACGKCFNYCPQNKSKQ